MQLPASGKDSDWLEKSERGDGEVLIGDGETHRYETQGTVRLSRDSS